MSEPKLISPMLDGFAIGAPFSDHHGVRCCPAMPQGSNDRYIVKIISIPASQVQLDALLLTGAYKDEESAREYFKELAEGVVAEVETLNDLARLEGFLPYKSYQIVPMENAVGYDVYLLSPYKRSLERHFRKEAMTHLSAINLGLDMCAALAVSRHKGYLFTDLKPSNIFISDDNEYRIGDIGFQSLSGLRYASLPDKYRSQYTAPEVSDAYSALNTTVDIYAAGLILYQAYNGGTLPFEGQAPTEELPAPVYADYEMAEIILKACSPDPSTRWQDPIQMGQALVSYMQRNGANDTPIVPPHVEYPDPAPDFEPEPQEEAALISQEELEIPEGITLPEEDPQISMEELLASAAMLSGAELSEAINLTEEESLPEADDTSVNEASEVAADEEEKPLVPIVPVLAEEAVDSAISTDTDQLPSAETSNPVTDSPAVLPTDDPANLDFLNELVNDETAPGFETVQDVQYNELSGETEDMLNQADDLISHPAPAPVIAPEAIDVPMPEPIVLAEETAEAPTGDIPQDDAPAEEDQDDGIIPVIVPSIAAALTEEAPALENEEAVPQDIPESPDPETTEETAAEEPLNEDDEAVIQALIADVPEEEAPAAPPQEENIEQYSDEAEPEKKEKTGAGKKALGIILTIVLIAALLVGAYLFYNEYYLQPVHSLVVTGESNTLTVTIQSDARENILKIVCVDEFGHRKEAPVNNGAAKFVDLQYGTNYTIRVEISGLHKLYGSISTKYKTPAETKIQDLVALTGSADGTVLLTFSEDNPDTDNWLVRYSTPGEAEQTKTFTGPRVELEGLTVGSTYTFTIDSPDDLFITGNPTVTHTVGTLLKAENARIVSCVDNMLTVRWDAPRGQAISSWTVRCQGTDSGYYKTLSVTETTAVFELLTTDDEYTVKIAAEGNSEEEVCYMRKNPITITDFKVTPLNATQLEVSFSHTDPDPENPWLVMYSIDGSENYRLPDNKIIDNYVPGSTYTFTIQVENSSVTVLSDLLVVTLDAPVAFNSHGVVADKMTFKMCPTPNVANWNRYHVASFSSTYSVGARASFLVNSGSPYRVDDELFTVMYVIRDADGLIVSCDTNSPISWRNMWYNRYCELDIPSLPDSAGTYTIEIFMNGGLAHEQEFVMTDAG